MGQLRFAGLVSVDLVGPPTLSRGHFAAMILAHANARLFPPGRAGRGVSSFTQDPPAEQQVRDAIKSPDLTVVHLWAPWCSNCQAELKNGGWTKMVKENPKMKFYFCFRLEQR